MRRLVILFLALVLAACAHPTAKPPAGPLLGEPLPPSSLGYSLILSQVVASQYKGTTHSLRVEVEVSPERLVMVGVSHLGVPLFSLELDGNGLRTTAVSAETLPFDPRYILSDFQLAHWPFELVSRDLERQGYQLVRGLQASGRYVYDAERELVASVEDLRDGKQAGYMVIEHYDLPYKLLIHTLDRSEGT
jgi:hypothetical protein